MCPSYNYEAFNSIYHLGRKTSEFPDFIPNLDYFILNSKALLTDMLSTSLISNGFLVSENLKLLLLKHKISTHKYYNAKVCYKNKHYEYYWMHIINDMFDVVNFNKSSFFVLQNFSQNLGGIKINSFNEYVIKKEKLKKDNPTKTVTIWAEKIVLNNKFSRDLDLFKIGSFSSQFFISEKLKENLIQENITGIKIKETNILYFE
ncbi:MAG: hypothetical protein U0T68_01910 [Ferruginibacter sp.]